MKKIHMKPFKYVPCTKNVLPQQVNILEFLFIKLTVLQSKCMANRKKAVPPNGINKGNSHNNHDEIEAPLKYQYRLSTKLFSSVF